MADGFWEERVLDTSDSLRRIVMYRRLPPIVVVVFTLLLGGMIQAAGLDVTAPGDTVRGVPNDGVTDGSSNFGLPGNEHPALAIDDDTSTKYLYFKGG